MASVATAWDGPDNSLVRRTYIQPYPRTGRRSCLIIVWLLIVLGIARLVANDTVANGKVANDNATLDVSRKGGSKTPSDVSGRDQSDENTRMREGAKLVDLVGDFQKSGDRYNFYPQDGKGVIRVLENLALERVARTLSDDPSPRQWIVSGIVTEFRGENYLLVTRAVLKTRISAGETWFGASATRFRSSSPA